MRRNGGGPVLLVLAIAVLLPAGAFAAATVEPDRRRTEFARVGAAGLALEALADDAPATPPTVPGATSTVVAPPNVVAPPPPLPRTGPSAAAAPSAPAPSTTAPPPAAGAAPTTTSTTTPQSQTTRWSRTANGVSVRMRMEPAMPVAGQPVTFFVDDVSTPDTCCIVHLSFGDGTDAPLIGGGPPSGASVCEHPTTRRTGLSIDHTYAAPGAYEVNLVIATIPCRLQVVNGQPVHPTVTGTDIRACIAVGPGTALPPRCAAVEHFRPAGA